MFYEEWSLAHKYRLSGAMQGKQAGGPLSCIRFFFWSVLISILTVELRKLCVDCVYMMSWKTKEIKMQMLFNILF